MKYGYPYPYVAGPATHRRASTLARIKEQSLNVVVVDALEEYLSAQGV